MSDNFFFRLLLYQLIIKPLALQINMHVIFTYESFNVYLITPQAMECCEQLIDLN